MDADWSVEAGADLPGIVVPWSDTDSGMQYVDLRAHPDAALALAEAYDQPALGDVLRRLNAPESAVFTSKCDLWPLSAQELDTLAIDLAQETRFFSGYGCYIDILLRTPDLFASFAAQESWMRGLCMELRGAESYGGVRVDFVLRPALCEELAGFAMTTYIFAGAASLSDARSGLDATLALVGALLIAGPRADTHTDSDAGRPPP